MILPARIVGAGLLSAALLLPASTAVAQPTSCESCHFESDSALVESVRSSVHAGVGCHGCHGGNPAVPDEAAMFDDPTFKGKPERKDVPEFCGGCHSDVRRMNPFGIQTDQLAQYKTSKHGEMLFGKGDENVAVCADCHGAHGIKSPKDPASTVYPTNIPSTCGRCHSDEKKMSKYKLPSSPPADYEHSVHAQALRVRKDLSAPTCATCHGNHGAAPPGVKQVSDVCGRCHVREAEAFGRSPHAAATETGKMKACVSCHSNHAILHPTEDLLRSACIDCHKGTDHKALTVRDEFLTGFGQLRQDVSAVSEDLHKAASRGFEVGEAQVQMEEAKTALIALTPAQHALDLADLSKVLRENNGRMEEIRKSIKEKVLSEGVRRLMFLPIAIFLVVLSIGFAAKRAEVEQNRGRE
ncbi:cytochrome c3 family protein [bacterium]|nr:cytochrome c3 family protein [bacterium]